MEDLRTILDRVLAGVGEMVAERKAGIPARVTVPGEAGSALNVNTQPGSTGERKKAGCAE